MNDYKHFIRIDSNNIVIDGYSDWQEDKRGTGEIQLSGEFSRHFQFQLMTSKGQFMYKLVNGAMTPRSQTELDAEWAARPPAIKTEIEIVKEENAQQNTQIIDLWESLLIAGVL
ncbi:hypothetical protein QFZ77_002456 [Paenibacillus sp. V4I3]|uniref:hypothetical protein n=1 Tax=Paenibacillus sp. V4I3 TaxID=3042305 RepID=UPI002785E5FC|nr:hypothetical protein [Paenibacillus sp. V4I3]MDQ0873797.1 hypothetical protein [Paenibacillus sp. V4I3]